MRDYLTTILAGDLSAPENMTAVYTDGRMIWIDDGTEEYSRGLTPVRKFRELVKVATQAEERLLFWFDEFLKACYPKLYWEWAHKEDALLEKFGMNNALEYLETTRAGLDDIWVDFSRYLHRVLIMGYDKVPPEWMPKDENIPKGSLERE